MPGPSRRENSSPSDPDRPCARVHKRARKRLESADDKIAGTVDGGPAGGSSRGSQFGRHQSHFGVDFEVERGRRREVACRRDKAVVVQFSRCQDWGGIAPRATAARARQHCWTPSSNICVQVQQSPPLKWRTVPIIEGGESAVREQSWEVPLAI